MIFFGIQVELVRKNIQAVNFRLDFLSLFWPKILGESSPTTKTAGHKGFHRSSRFEQPVQIFRSLWVQTFVFGKFDEKRCQVILFGILTDYLLSDSIKLPEQTKLGKKYQTLGTFKKSPLSGG